MNLGNLTIVCSVLGTPVHRHIPSVYGTGKIIILKVPRTKSHVPPPTKSIMSRTQSDDPKGEAYLLNLTHCSVRALSSDALVDVQQTYTVFGKPIGLWMALGSSWIMNGFTQSPSFRKNFFGTNASTRVHMYRVHVSYKTMLHWIHTENPSATEAQAGTFRSRLLTMYGRDAAMAFHRRYRKQYMPHARSHEEIDWVRVASHFAGVYFFGVEPGTGDPQWYLSLDIDSACVWRPSALHLKLHPVPRSKIEADVKRVKAFVRSVNF